MGFFKKNIFNAKQMKFNNFKYNPAIKKLLGDKEVSRILDTRAERKEFYDYLKTRSKDDGCSLNDIRTTLGDFRSGRGKTISGKEAHLLAGAFKKKGIIPNQGSFTKSYIFKPEEKKIAGQADLSKKIERKTPDRSAVDKPQSQNLGGRGGN